MRVLRPMFLITDAQDNVRLDVIGRHILRLHDHDTQRSPVWTKAVQGTLTIGALAIDTGARRECGWRRTSCPVNGLRGLASGQLDDRATITVHLERLRPHMVFALEDAPEVRPDMGNTPARSQHYASRHVANLCHGTSGSREG